MAVNVVGTQPTSRSLCLATYKEPERNKMQTKQNIEFDVSYVFDKTEDLKTWYDYIRAKSRKEKKNNNKKTTTKSHH